MKYTIKNAGRVREGECVLVKGKWCGPVTLVESNPDVPSNVLISWADGTYETDAANSVETQQA